MNVKTHNIPQKGKNGKEDRENKSTRNWPDNLVSKGLLMDSISNEKRFLIARGQSYRIHTFSFVKFLIFLSLLFGSWDIFFIPLFGSNPLFIYMDPLPT